MFSYSIGLTGLHVAQRAIEFVGMNIANAGTEGYHRQELKIDPLELGTIDQLMLGGAEISEAIRSIDRLLEQELLRQAPLLGQTSQELESLQLIERAMGDLESGGLSGAIGSFFDSLQELAAQPSSNAMQQQAVWAADAMCAQFHNLAAFLDDLAGNVWSQAHAVTGNVNGLLGEIAELNGDIAHLTIKDTNANILLDQRDQAISRLAEVVEVEIDTQTPVLEGVVNVSVGGTPVVMGTNVTELEIGALADGSLGLSVKDANYYTDDVQGGKLGGLFALANEIIPDLQNGIDSLAGAIVSGLNRFHAEGIGAAGSFDELVGQAKGDASATLTEIDPTIAAGTLRVRVVDTDTGEATVHEIQIADPATMTFGDLASAIDGLDHISAGISDQALRIIADGGYTFDFLPVTTAEFDPADWTAGNTAEIDVTGIFQGQANEDFTVTVVDGGGVGVAGSLALEVTDGEGNFLTRFNVGQGYAAGDGLDLGNGIVLHLGAGDLVAGDSFTIHALARSDTTGALSVLGMNTLFAGNSAGTISLREEVFLAPERLACFLGADGADNNNIRRMADLGDESLAELGGQTFLAYHSQLITGIGQAVMVRAARQRSLENISQQLLTQRQDVSGIDVNDEAAKLMVFERMYQAMAKFLSTQDQAIQSLMDIL